MVMNSVTRITFWHHGVKEFSIRNEEPLWILFLGYFWTRAFNLKYVFFYPFLSVAIYLHFQSRHVRFGFYYLWRWRRNVWWKLEIKPDVITYKMRHYVMHESHFTPHCVKRHFLSSVCHAEIPVRCERKEESFNQRFTVKIIKFRTPENLL